MLELPEIAIHFVHAAVLAALRDVELLLDVFLALAPELARPDLLERLLENIPVQEALVEQVRAAAVEVAVGHDVRPEVRRGHALRVVAVLVRHAPPPLAGGRHVGTGPGWVFRLCGKGWSGP